MIAADVLSRLASVSRLDSANILKSAATDTTFWQQKMALAKRHRPRISAALSPHPEILVFDCKTTESLPGSLIADPISSADQTVTRTHKTTVALIDFFHSVFGRNSIDGAGMTVSSSVHFSKSYPNAMWDGQQMIYGDGDGLMLLDFTLSDDFIGHELMHGVTQFTAGLDDDDEPGALNESMSDVFGSMFRQWRAGQTTEEADWLIGSQLMGPTALSLGWTCIRDMARPNAAHSLTQQPVVYSDYVVGGEPHINSGIPNRAFYLAASALRDHSWDKAGKVWFSVLTSKDATPRMTIPEFASISLRVSNALFPSDATVAAAIKNAWITVEVPL